MIDALRKGAGSIAAKILLGLLIASFAAWGVADMIVPRPSTTVVTVDGAAIGTDEYMRRFDRELILTGLQFRQRLSQQQGRAMGLDKRVLAQLLVDAHARELGLSLSDEALSTRIHDIESFQGSDGKFSKRVFDDAMQQLGFSEGAFVHFERQDALRNQIMQQMSTVAPSTLVEAANRFQNEERKVEHFTVPLEKAGVIAPPDEAKLKEYYEQNQRSYVAPETRRLAVLLATPEVLKDRVSVAVEEARAAYDKNLSRYGTPEKRKVQQITFPDEAAANKAYAELEAGKDFIEVAKAAGRTEADIDRGLVARDGLVDPAIAEAAFKLASGSYSAPVVGTLSTSILRVTEIVPGVQKPFAEVESEITDGLKVERARKLIGEQYDKVEDLRAAGTPLKDIAAQLGLKLVEIAAVDRQGNGPDGKPVAELAAYPQVLKLAYESDVGVETDPVDLGAAGFAWVDVVEVTPERQKPLEEVRDAAKAAYIEAEGKRALAKLADALAERAGKSEDFAALAQEAGATVSASEAFKRGDTPQGLPRTLPIRAFSLAKGGAASVAGDDGKSRVVFRVTDVIAAKPLDEESRKALADALARQRQNDISGEYAAALEKRYGLAVNEPVFNRLIGEAAP